MKSPCWSLTRFTTFVVLIALAALAILITPREPTWGGRRLSEWILVTGAKQGDPDLKSAATAIGSIGQRGLPWLVKWIAVDMDARQRMYNRIQKLPAPVLRTRFGQEMLRAYDPLRANALANAAVWPGFQALGPGGAPAIPKLLRIAKRGKLRGSSTWAMCALCQMHEAGVAPLISLASDRCNSNRASAAFYLGSMAKMGPWGTNTHSAVAALVDCLENNHGDRILVGSAINALGAGHADPELAVPALTNVFVNADWELRHSAVCSLRDFGTNAYLALPALVNVLEHEREQPIIAASAAEILGQMALQPELTIPALTNSLQGKRYDVRRAAAYALGQFHERGQSAIPALIRALDDSDRSVRTQAKRAICDIDRQFYFAAGIRDRN